MIRDASDGDLPVIHELEQMLFDNAMSENMLASEIKLGRAWVYGDPVDGYALTRTDNNITDITRLGVRINRQGNGVGQALLDRVIENSGELILTVRKVNIPAIKLYKRNGFSIVGYLFEAKAFVMQRLATAPNNSFRISY